MKTAARRTPADRDRAVARLRTLTIGSVQATAAPTAATAKAQAATGSS